MKKLLRRIIYSILARAGYSTFASQELIQTFLAEIRFIRSRKFSLRECVWAWRRGFFADDIRKYGKKACYKDYMPSFTYLRTHPVNGRYSSWIDDKLTIKYILSSFSTYLPEYYYLYKDKSIISLMDSPSGKEADFAAFFELLKEKGDLALKPVAGAYGKGFYRVSYKIGQYFLNLVEISKNDLEGLMSSLEDYLITEYVRTHSEVRRIYDGSANTLRMMTVKTKTGDPKICGSFFKIGTSSSGVVENLHTGGILCRVDLSDGRISDPCVYHNRQRVTIKAHPDTNIKIEGYIPHWQLISKKIIEISQFIDQVKYIGYDILITQESFKIIELNSPYIRQVS